MSNKRREWVPETAKAYAEFLLTLQGNRVTPEKKQDRKPLTKGERSQILLKTDCRCHICGGAIEDKWEADHVLPHSAGGLHSVDNFLPSHSVCNNYRWFYSPEEFQEIMRLGVWIRTRIAKETRLGEQVADKFITHEKSRIRRRSVKSKTFD